MKKTKITKNSEINSCLLAACKIASYSLVDERIIIDQFNMLTATQRTDIASEVSRRESRLKAKVEPGNQDMCLTCVMVDLNIIAAKYDIDPATVCLCIKPSCDLNEKIKMK